LIIIFTTHVTPNVVEYVAILGLLIINLRNLKKGEKLRVTYAFKSREF